MACYISHVFLSCALKRIFIFFVYFTAICYFIVVLIVYLLYDSFYLKGFPLCFLTGMLHFSISSSYQFVFSLIFLSSLLNSVFKSQIIFLLTFSVCVCIQCIYSYPLGVQWSISSCFLNSFNSLMHFMIVLIKFCVLGWLCLGSCFCDLIWIYRLHWLSVCYDNLTFLRLNQCRSFMVWSQPGWVHCLTRPCKDVSQTTGLELSLWVQRWQWVARRMGEERSISPVKSGSWTEQFQRSFIWT